MILVKLGGSLLTNKAKRYSFRKARMERLAKELKLAAKELVLVHGAGSFGHILAKKYKLNDPSIDISKKKFGIAKVQRDVRLLNLKVIDCMLKHGLLPISIPPSVIVGSENNKIKYFRAQPFRTCLEHNLLPLTFGDVIPDEKLGFTICSGDLLMLELAKKLKPELAIFVLDVDGFYESDPKLNKKAKFLAELRPAVFSKIREKEGRVSRFPDVTGGATGKMKCCLELATLTKVRVLNGTVKNRLRDALLGKKIICTRVVA